MKSLVIAEKPSVARDIARVLHCSRKSAGAIEGDKYIVTWGLGHLVTLADPEEYDHKWKEWNMDFLPMIPKEWKLIVIPQTARQYQAVKSQIVRKDVKDIIIATDAGREGELVARWILEKVHNTKPLRRLWISSVTDKAIREGFEHLKDGKEYEPLYHAAVARAESDWLVGINATRALTCKYNAQLSCGRVQTPTLAMVAAREEQIRTFRPESYYGIRAVAGGISFLWQDVKSGSTRTFERQRAEEITGKLKGAGLKLVSVQKSQKKNYAPGLYDLTELQRDGNKRFGYSAKQTLDIMQRLYENHKVLTYPRTDSRYIGKDVAETLRERLRACQTGPYKKLAGEILKKGPVKSSRYIDDSKVSDHHAIIPTEQFVQMEHMTVDERRIYDLVVRRFLAVMYPASEYEQTTIKADAAGEQFMARGQIMKVPGWKAVYEETEISEEDEDAQDEIREQILPEVCQGDTLTVTKLDMTEGRTKPPAAFTEATLLSAMENPSRYLQVKSKEAVKTLGETGGLGTVATRADIIEKLFNSFLMEKRGNEIHTTSKAKQLLELVPEDLKKPELTADWESKLSEIAKGRLQKQKFMGEIRAYSQELITEIRTAAGTFRHDNLTNSKCPVCGKRMLAVNGKNSKMLVCQDRECGHRETISRTTNARCPKCHKRMEMHGKGDAQTFVCACGYKEKMSAFEARRNKEGKGVSKKDVQKYMNTQKKEAQAPLNNAFADAFARLQDK